MVRGCIPCRGNNKKNKVPSIAEHLVEKGVISMKKIIIIGLSLALGLALMVTTAMAWGPRFYPGSGMRPELGLSLPILGEKQFYKVEALQEAFLKETEVLQHDLLTKKTVLQILELAPIPDPTALKAKQEEIWNLQSKIEEKVSNLRYEIWKILNSEQRAQFDASGPGIGFKSHIGWGPTSG
jgi:Spy/CpxP family protein refolding chaperone